MVTAYAAQSSGSKIEPIEYALEKLGPNDVEIEVKHCGICHSDLSMWKNDWNMTSYPFVGGHEVTGIVRAIGDRVTHIQIGDKVGVGWHKGYCNTCSLCLGGDHNLCPHQIATIVDNFGGFSETLHAQDLSVIKIPDELDIQDAGPLLCGGITVFNPLYQFGVKPTDRIGVMGIGGLGHLALQFSKAWGCEVTALTSESKMEEARQLGAHHCINSRDPKAIARAEGSFDLVLSTVNVHMDWKSIVKTLKPKGKLHFLGVLTSPVELEVFPLIANQCSVSGSPVGSPYTLNVMMEFAARHQIKAWTEHFKMNEINEAFAHLESGQARYRIILDN